MTQRDGSVGTDITSTQSAGARQNQAARATFAGAGNLSVEATVPVISTAHQGNATFDGRGGMSVQEGDAYAVVSYAVVQFPADYSGQATFAGAGDFSAAIRLQGRIAATFTGAGNISAAAIQRMVGRATFNGTGSLACEATVPAGAANQWSGEARFNGSGSLSATTRQALQARATFAGAGGMSARQGDAHIVVSYAAIQVPVAYSIAATFAGSGSLSVEATSDVAQQGNATFQGAGNLSAEATVIAGAGTQHSGQATFQGSGSLSIAARQNMSVANTFEGAGSLSALAYKTSTLAATFAGAGQLSCDTIKLVTLTPDGDSSTGGWLNEVDGVPLAPSIDEIVPIDADYIKSSPAPAIDICKISMSNPLTSTLVAPVIVSYRYGKSGSDTAALQVRLLQGTTLIAVWQHSNIASSFTTVDQTLDSMMIASITDWNDLFLEFKSGTITVHMGRATFAGEGVM